VAMSGRNHSNAGGKVEKLISVYVFYAYPAAALGHHGIGTGIAGGDIAIITINNRARVRTRYRAKEFRAVLGKDSAVFVTVLLHQASLLSRKYFYESIDRGAVGVRAELRRRGS
jgi:hypothetical protein